MLFLVFFFFKAKLKSVKLIVAERKEQQIHKEETISC